MINAEFAKVMQEIGNLKAYLQGFSSEKLGDMNNVQSLTTLHSQQLRQLEDSAGGLMLQVEQLQQQLSA